MRIGELARSVGVSTDTVRFYERAGLLPRPARRDNEYREYAEQDVEHLRLLVDLRRLDLPLEDAARIASWCHSGHCADASAELPAVIAARRAEIAGRMLRLAELDRRLERLERHLDRADRALSILEAGPCCATADVVLGSVEGICPCCAPGADDEPGVPARTRA